MSEENVKLLHRAMEGGYHGHDRIRRWWQDLFGVFPNWRVEVTEVRDRADLTVARLQASGHGGETGTPVDQTLWQLVEWSANGKGVRVIHHASEAEVLQAAGLSE